MQISSINNQNFSSARLVQNPKRCYNRATRTTEYREIGKQEALSTYDDAIQKLSEKKYIAKQLHNFMASPEGKSLLERCPDGDTVEIYTKLETEEDDKSNIYVAQPSIYYGFDSDESMEKFNQIERGSDNISGYEVKTIINENGMKVLDTQGIKDWFNQIYEFLGK